MFRQEINRSCKQTCFRLYSPEPIHITSRDYPYFYGKYSDERHSLGALIQTFTVKSRLATSTGLNYTHSFCIQLVLPPSTNTKKPYFVEPSQFSHSNRRCFPELYNQVKTFQVQRQSLYILHINFPLLRSYQTSHSVTLYLKQLSRLVLCALHYKKSL